eukprot:maker-scaffold_3-snap-gene-21.3-mRNA-1 protein AED:0.00 eAED:0.00 QI:111/1/1/1/1/1/3/124/627
MKKRKTYLLQTLITLSITLSIISISKTYTSISTPHHILSNSKSPMSRVLSLEHFFDSDDCQSLEFCQNLESECYEPFPLTCCNPENEECHTHDGTICKEDKLCASELLPGGSGEALCLKSWELNGGIIIYILIILYLFVALAIICDDYFVPCLEHISHMLDLSEDVAGATFMAAGSSAPELFVSLADNVFANPPKNFGIGTIIGSAIFNILIIIGLSAILAGKELILNWKPFLRDSLFYFVSIVVMVIVVWDEEVKWYEGLILFLVYLLYVLFMKYYLLVFAKVDSLFLKKEAELAKEDSSGTINPIHLSVNRPGFVPRRSSQVVWDMHNVAKTMFTVHKAKNKFIQKLAESKRKKEVEKAEEVEAYFSVLIFDKNAELKKQLVFLLCFPLNLLLRLTVPDLTHPLMLKKKEASAPEEIKSNPKPAENNADLNEFAIQDAPKAEENGPQLRHSVSFTLNPAPEGHEEPAVWLVIITFISCIIWIAITSHFLTFAAGKFGCLVGISPEALGLTLLAAGTSVPDAISSIIVARNGQGDMAVANSLGSNVFDILIGLGIPWLVASFVFEGPVDVQRGDLELGVLFLVVVFVALVGLLVATKWTLNPRLGYSLVLLYAVYVIFELFIRPIL